jgi:hypothetical protein
MKTAIHKTVLTFYGRFHRPLALLIHHSTQLSYAAQVRARYSSAIRTIPPFVAVPYAIVQASVFDLGSPRDQAHICSEEAVV